MTHKLRQTDPDGPPTLAGLCAAYAEGCDPAEVIEALLARLAAVDDPAIFLHVGDRDSLLRAARALGRWDPSKPLWGIPFAVKDNIDVAGMPTTAACPAFAYTPDRDAFVVARLRAAGAIPVGKTNLDQFATGLVGVRSPYGVPRNALDPEIVPGGSSSGSAVAVARGIVPFALGTDTAGSGRVPAALNGIVGLKPSLGALSATGVVPACRTLDTISVFAQTVEEAYTVFRAAAAFDPADAYARPIAVPPLPAPLPAPRIVAPDTGSLVFFGDSLQAADFEASLDRLARSGARIERRDFTPFHDVAGMLYDGAWVAERYAAIEPVIEAHPDAIHPVTRAIIERAETLSAVDAFRGLYRLEELRRAVAPILAAADMLCVPSIPTFYSLADLEADPVTPNANLGTYTNFVNLLDLCALAVPTGRRGDGRPGGVTLIARSGGDGRIAAESVRLTTGLAPDAAADPDASEGSELRDDVQENALRVVGEIGQVVGHPPPFVARSRPSRCSRTCL
jgi:allophanate hydrolase